MMYARKVGILWLFFSLILVVSGQAQKIYSEEEINREKLFLEAYKQKIIGKYDEAIDLYKKLYEESPESHASAFELARIYDQQRQSTEAIDWMKRAESGNPNNVYYKEFLAELFQSSGRFTEAAEVYKGLAKKTSSHYYYYRWAYYLVRANKIDDAIKVYDELEKLAGINEETIRRKHALYMGQGNTKKAVRELEKLLGVFPQSIEYHHLLAAFYEQVGEKKEAKAVYEKIISLDPDNAKAQMALAGRSASSNNDLQYLSSLRGAFEQEGVDLDLKMSKLIPFIQKVADTGNQELAEGSLELTDILEQVHPDDAKPYAAAGDLLFYTRRFKEAQEKYRQTLDLDETVFSVWEQLAMTYLLQGDFEQLLEVTNDGIDLFPNKAQLYYFNGLAALELGEYNDAQSVFDQAVLMSSRDQALKQRVLSGLGAAYTALGDFDGADRVFTEALALNDKSPETLARYSLSLSAREGAQERATELAEQALKQAAGYPLALQAQGMALYKKQDFEQAKMVLNKALESTQEQQTPSLLEGYGDVLYQLGEAEEALKYWQKAREKGKQTKALDKKINDRKI